MIDLLRHAELFSQLSAEDLSYIVGRSSAHRIPADSCLFRPGELAAAFFVVARGSVRVFRLRESGAAELMGLFVPGDALGDFDFARGASYDAWAESEGETEIIRFPAEGFSLEDMAQERPDIVARLKLRSLAMIASRLRSTNKLISENAPWVRELRRQAYEDPTTGLWTRTFLDEELTAILAAPLAIVVLKPQRFKDLVDARGHAAGDEAMVRLAAVLKDLIRLLGRGWALRLRSNETALVVPELPLKQAQELAVSVRERVAAIRPFTAKDGFAAFHFEATVAWAVWPLDGGDWGNLLTAVHTDCLAAWKTEDTRLVHTGGLA